MNDWVYQGFEVTYANLGVHLILIIMKAKPIY